MIRLPKVSLPVQILIGLALGIFAGFFFGELTSFLAPIGEAFVMLLKMSVLPYITLALMHGLGVLKPTQAKQLVKYGVLFLVLTWVVTMVTIYAFSYAYPPRETAAFYAAAEKPAEAQISVLRLFIPENPFYALANNIVPAIVIFSVFFGLALMFLKEKENLLNVMEAAIGALSKIIQAVVRLSPYGIFALIASTTGTTTFQQFAKLEAYLIGFVLMTIFLALWALPAMVTSFTALSYRRLLKELQAPLLLAFSTGNIFVSLPYIMDSLTTLSKEGENEREMRTLAETLAPISYNLPLVGNLMAMSVILFLAYFYAIDFTFFQNIRLIISSIFTLVGPVAAGLNSISFLVDTLHLPTEGVTIFVETSAVTRNLQGLAGSAGIAVFTLLTLFAFSGQIRIQLRKLIFNGVATVALLLLLVALAAFLTPEPSPETSPFPKLRIDSPVSATVYQPGEALPSREPRQAGESWLDRIKRTQTLRVGYNTWAEPFAYLNEYGELVGYDIAMAHSLAQTLGVALEFIPLNYDQIADEFKEDRYDIAMSAITANTERLKRILFSSPVIQVDGAFIVFDYRREEFADLDQVRKRKGLRFGALTGSAWEELARKEFPNASIVPLKTYDEALGMTNLDAIISSNQEGLTWALLHPQYTIVVPEPTLQKSFYAYPVDHDAYEWLHFVDYWLSLKKLDGFTDREYKKWVLGQPAVKPQRWSVIRNVLGWVD